MRGRCSKSMRTASTRSTASSQDDHRQSRRPARSRINSIAAAISEEKDAIEDIYEPFRIQRGFLGFARPGVA